MKCDVADCIEGSEYGSELILIGHTKNMRVLEYICYSCGTFYRKIQQ